jgi:hypothetical protein
MPRARATVGDPLAELYELIIGTGMRNGPFNFC